MYISPLLLAEGCRYASADIRRSFLAKATSKKIHTQIFIAYRSNVYIALDDCFSFDKYFQNVCVFHQFKDSSFITVLVGLFYEYDLQF